MNDALGRIGLRDADERGAFIGVALTLSLILLVGLFFGLKRADRQVGSNAVGVGAVIAHVSSGHTVCSSGHHMPAGTARLQLWLGPATRPASFDLILKSNSGRSAMLKDVPVTAAGYQFVDLPRVSWKLTDTRSICIRGADGKIEIGGAAVDPLPGDPPATRDGKPFVTDQPAVHYYTGADDRPLQLSKLVSVFKNADVLHGPLYPWVMLLTLLVALLATLYALFALITASRHSLRRLAWIFMVASFMWCVSWSVMSPPFQGNDESEHYANLEHLATSGNAPDLREIGNEKPPYSSYQSLTMRAARHNAVVVDGGARPFWDSSRSRQADAWLDGAERDDGGGYTVSASGHSGLYYALFTPFYRATAWMQPANQLVVMRTVNAFAAAFIAFLAVLSAGLLLGEARRLPAACAGALVAFQPMFAYVSGAINNDTFVNVAGAAAVYLLLLLAQKGWSVRREVWLGVVAVAGVLGKITAVSIALYTATTVILMVLRDRSARAVRGGFTILGVVVASCLSWLGLATLLGWPRTLTYFHTNVLPVAEATQPTTLQRIDYVIQQIFPPLHLTGPMVQVNDAFERIYIVGGFADLFWHRISYPMSVYHLIRDLLVILFLCGLVALWRYRRVALRNWLAVLIILLQPVFVYVLVEWAYATPGGRNPLAEQGRYIFPALVALAVGAVAAIYGLPTRLRPYVWGGLAGAMCAFGIVTWFFGAYHVYA
ncbi:MAG: DUF2142 domain-containing protein [Thermoleophilaceae bacterium]|nr:DUF2142 domain-containing protein [Thermoleophilaceae bacterium]